MPSDCLLTEKEVADLLGYSTKRLQAARISGDLRIPFIQLSARAIRYRMSEVDEWIASHKSFRSTAEYPQSVKCSEKETPRSGGERVITRPMIRR
jgi:predicted DNA-binding transcriptional regulator AlpA